MKWMSKLKEKWSIKSNFQLIIILIVFSITGSMTLWIAAPLLLLVGANKEDMNPWIFYTIRIAIIFPAYQILILIVGALFGQFSFFWNFEKKILARMGFKKFKDK